MVSKAATWIESFDVLMLFPTFVWKTQLAKALHEPLDTRILEMLERLRRNETPVTELTSGNTDEVVVRVQNGTLLLFPSYLQHSVDPHQRDGDRVSISFNIMFTGFTEQSSKPLWGPAHTTGNGSGR